MRHVRPDLNSLLVIPFALALVVEACKKDAPSSWRSYTNTTLGFAFRYPGDWSEANTIVDRAKVKWINFSASSAGAVMISHGNLLLEIGDPSKEGYLTQILATFRFSK